MSDRTSSPMQTFELSSDRASTLLSCTCLGTGVDIATLTPRSVALDLPTITPSRTTPSLRDSVTYTLEAVDRSELQTESTSFRGSFRASLAALSGRVSGGATFADNVSRQSNFIRASVRVVKYVVTIDVEDALLLPGVSPEDADFQEIYGNGVVATVTYGGRLDALISVRKEEKNELEEFDVEGEIDAVVAKASGSFRQRIAKATSKREVDISIEQRGGRLVQVRLAPSVENLLDAVKEFPGQIRGHDDDDSAVPLAFSVLKYANLPAVLRGVLDPPRGVGGITKEVLLMEQVARLVQQYEITRRMVDGRIDIGEVISVDGRDRLARMLAAYRRLVSEKAKAFEVLVRGELDEESLKEEVVDSFPLAFKLVYGEPVCGAVAL